MKTYEKINPLLSYNSVILGIIIIIVGIILLLYNFIFKKLNIDIPLWFFCFGLFCLGYRKEKFEKEKDIDFIIRRYHSFRISIALTTVIVLIMCSSFIFSKTGIGINGLHTLLIFWLIFNISFILIKIYERGKELDQKN
jgi:hypothetical protein